MASSKVMASSSTSANSDLARQPSTYSLTIGELQGDQSKNFGSMNMDELFRNIYGDNSTNNELIHPESNGAAAAAASAATGGGGGGGDGDGDGDGELNGEGRRGGGGISLSREGSFSLRKHKTAEEVWKEINTSTTGGGGGGDDDEMKVRSTGGGGGGDGGQFSEMTLEDFLARAGAVREEDVKYPTVVAPVTGFVIDSPLDARFHQHQIEGSILGFGNSMEGGRVVVGGGGGGGGGGGRGKRRAVQEPIDKVAQQRQRRMIKNRESAARSRERKQAYTVELETLVSRLEEENAQLLREQEERVKERYKQLMETLIPVQEKRRPPRVLRRVGSAQW